MAHLILSRYKSTIPTHQGSLDWVWEPFKEPEDSSIWKICGRIAFILSNARSIPDYLQGYELDPRFSIPLSVVGLSDEACEDIHDIDLGSYGKVIKYHGVNLRISLEEKKRMEQIAGTRIEEETERVKSNVNKALERIESRDDSPQYLKSMDKKLQFDFVRRILSGRKPTQSDWLNVLRKDVYEFDTSWHYYTILVIAGFLSIISIGYIGWKIFNSETLLSYWNVFLGFLIFAVLYDWYCFLHYSFKAILSHYLFLDYFILGVSKVPSDLTNLEIPEGFLLLPFMAWAPAIGYFTTAFLLNFVSWLVVVLVWVIIIGGCISLTVIGLRKDERSKNPLKGILEVAEKLPSLK